MDKSKADGLKKTIVCAQALWFCVQCFTRLAQALPVSLLEVNTFAHAVCTLLIYVLWWHKPLDVEEPTEVEDPRLLPIFAYMWMTSRVSANDYTGDNIGGQLRDEFDCIWPFENPVPGDLILQARTPEATDPGNFPSAKGHPLESSQQGFTEITVPEKSLVPGHHDYDWRRYPSSKTSMHMAWSYLLWTWYGDKWSTLPSAIKHMLRLFSNRSPGRSSRSTAIDHLSLQSLARWELAHSAIKRYDLELDLRIRHAMPVNGLRLRSRITLRQRNVVLSPRLLHMGTAVATSAASYGTLHLLAWNAVFPSPVEQLLWRISASCVTGNLMLLGLTARLISFQPMTKLWPWISARLETASKARRAKFSWASIGDGLVGALLVIILCMWWSLFPALWFSYVLSRMYLVVESFRSLAYLPPGVFQTPTWPAYLPHLS